jgi:hypothetical protein
MKVSFPVAAGSRGVQDGSLPTAIESFIERMQPEAAYFTAYGGKRTAFFVLDLRDASMMPSTVEPFFGPFDASVELTPAMNLEELRKGIATLKGDGSKSAQRPIRTVTTPSK